MALDFKTSGAFQKGIDKTTPPLSKVSFSELSVLIASELTQAKNTQKVTHTI